MRIASRTVPFETPNCSDHLGLVRQARTAFQVAFDHPVLDPVGDLNGAGASRRTGFAVGG
jgi:hypothetical protein